MKRRSNRILTYALALSLALHLALAISIHNVRPVEARQEPPQRLTIIQIHTPPPPPPPTPTPKPQPPKPQPRVTHTRPVAHPPHVTDKPDSKTVAVEPVASTAPGTPGPVVTDGPGIGPPSSPEPTPSPKPMCSVPNVPAKAVDVMSPTVPDGVDATDAMARVRVTLDAEGAVQRVSVYQSAGNILLDRAAMLAARQSTYRAEIRDCLPVSGDYLFTVDFQE